MTTLKLKTNLNCGSCVAKVTPELDAIHGITSWNVATDNPDKVLTVEGSRITEDSIRAAVAKAGFQVLGPVAGQGPSADAAPASKSLKTYYPLVLILAYIAGVVALGQVASGGWDWMVAMRHFMAGFFLVFSFFKLLDLPAFAAAYGGYDVIARRWPFYGFVYPFIELALGIACLVNFWPTATNAATLAVMLISAWGVVRALLDKKAIRCACLGSVFNLPMSFVTLVEDGLMAAMAAVMLLVK